MHCLVFFKTKLVLTFVVWRKQNPTQAFGFSNIELNKMKYRSYMCLT